MATTALYHWNVAGAPVNVLIELPAVDRLRAAAVRPEAEIGGILLGTFDGNFTVITGFEEIESEHRRGVGYALSAKDERRLASRLGARSRKDREQVVGFFRSHRRSGMYLDESDNSILSNYFRSPQQVAMLVKPGPDGTATGGFFFWEDGDLNRKQSYLQFPMDSRELTEGDFPLVEPVEATSGAASAEAEAVGSRAGSAETAVKAESNGKPVATAAGSSFETMDTLDYLPGPAVPKGATAEELAALSQAVAAELPLPIHSERRVVEPPRAARNEPAPAGGSRWSVSWSLVGALVAIAAVGGYLIGTSASHGDRFGQRPGDIALGTEPAEPQQASPAQAPPSQAAPNQTRPNQATPNQTDSAQPLPNAAAPGQLPQSEPAQARPIQSQAPGSSAMAEPSAVPQAKRRPSEAPEPKPETPKISPTQVATKMRPRPSAPGAGTTAPVQPSATEALGSSAVARSGSVPQESTGGALTSAAPNPGISRAEIPGAPPPKPADFAWSRYSTPVAKPRREPLATASVSVEPVESGALKRATHHIPLFGAIGGQYHGGDHFTPPQAIRSFAPRVPAEVARTLTGTTPVDLKLKIDKSGRVSGVEIMSKAAVPQLVEIAGDAAYNWQFEPAHLKDKTVPSEVIAHFRFHPAM